MGTKPFAGIVGYVLAGGASSRFGRDKSQAVIGGQPMLARMQELLRSVCSEVRVVAAGPAAAGEGVSVIADRWPGEGPLGGIITAMLATAEAATSNDWNLIVGCDMPFLNAAWLRHLAERTEVSSAEVIAPRSSNGLEPLCAVWRTSAASKLRTAFSSGVRKITESMKRLQMEIIEESEWQRFDSSGRLFWNMNTVAEYEEAKQLLESGKA